METSEYKFVEMEGTGIFSVQPEGDYKALISSHGREGWRLVQIFSAVVAAGGPPKTYTFIFERRIPDAAAS